MIPEEIINRLNLELTHQQNGVSFINNVGVYSWPAMSKSQRTVYVSDGDARGERLSENMYMIFTYDKVNNKKYWASFLLPAEILLNQEMEKLITLCEGQIERIISQTAIEAEE